MSFETAQSQYERMEPPTYDDDALCCNCRQLWSKHEMTAEFDEEIEGEAIERYFCPDNSGAEYEELTDEMLAEEAAEQKMAERYGR